jgi:glycosyltransferase involved in cell wall biosynthesis
MAASQREWRMSPDLVSIVTPFFNTRRFLAEAIESVLAQSYRPIELLLVDDGSTDGGGDVAERFTERATNVSLIRLPHNQGQATARNVAVQRSRGRYVTFLDADDVMLPDRVDFQVDYLVTHPGIDVVIGSAEYFLEPGVAPPEWLQDRVIPGQNRHRNPMTMMARREVFVRVGPFDPSFANGEDTDWVFRAVSAGMAIARTDRILMRRRIHGANLTYDTTRIRNAVRRIVLRSVRERLGARRGSL